MLFNFSLNRLATAASVAAMTVGLSFVASPAQKASAQISGSGATSIVPLIEPWAAGSGVGVSYNATGSGTGRTEFANGVTDFVSSDLTLPNVDNQVITNPVNLTVGLAYNAPDYNANLSTSQICGIFAGTITNWQELGGPDLPITVVYRADSSGTTAILNTFISRECGFSVPPFPVGIGVSGSQGLVDTISSTPGAIGYVEETIAQQSGVPVAVLDTVIAGPNYFVFRSSYSSAETATAAQAFCRYITGPAAGDIAISLGYNVPGQDPSVCDRIQGPAEVPPVEVPPEVPVEE